MLQPVHENKFPQAKWCLTGLKQQQQQQQQKKTNKTKHENKGEFYYPLICD